MTTLRSWRSHDLSPIPFSPIYGLLVGGSFIALKLWATPLVVLLTVIFLYVFNADRLLKWWVRLLNPRNW